VHKALNITVATANTEHGACSLAACIIASLVSSGVRAEDGLQKNQNVVMCVLS
jgi:hypothetical protein